MKILKYIFFLLLVLLGLFQTNAEIKAFFIENEKIEVLAEHDFKGISTEKRWLSLLYLQESTNQNQSLLLPFSSGSLNQNFSGRLCSKSISEILELEFQVGRNLESHQGSCGRNGKVFQGSAALVESWKSFKNAGLDDLARNTDNLDALNKALKQGDYDAAYFENLLKTKSDPQKFIDDYVKKLGDDGKFLDADMETKYTDYLARKAREGKTPRDRADWNHARDYWLNDSPMARGIHLMKLQELKVGILMMK